jgi:putative ABC transport system permease protein
MALVVVGVAMGSLAAVAAGRLIRGLLHGVPPHDPATCAGVGAALCATGLIAAWIPAFRAARIDPIRAMKTE